MNCTASMRCLVVQKLTTEEDTTGTSQFSQHVNLPDATLADCIIYYISLNELMLCYISVSLCPNFELVSKS